MSEYAALYGKVIRSWPDIDPTQEYSESTFRDKDFGNLMPFIGPRQPIPTVTAYKGFEGDAYYFQSGEWLHCLTGAVWFPTQDRIDVLYR